MADGGFSVEKQENLQEVLSKHLILCELLCGLSVLGVGGHLVCKLFDCFTHFTVSLLYLAAYMCFQSGTHSTHALHTMPYMHTLPYMDTMTYMHTMSYMHTMPCKHTLSYMDTMPYMHTMTYMDTMPCMHTSNGFLTRIFFRNVKNVLNICNM